MNANAKILKLAHVDGGTVYQGVEIAGKTWVATGRPSRDLEYVKKFMAEDYEGEGEIEVITQDQLPDLGAEKHAAGSILTTSSHAL